MSRIQRWVTSLVSAKIAMDIEAQSRLWTMICPNCGHERSYWEIGGIRWKAAGNPRNLQRCPQCGQATWHITYYKPTPDSPPPPHILRKLRKS